MVGRTTGLVLVPLRQQGVLGKNQILSEFLPVEDVRQIELADLNPLHLGADGQHSHPPDVRRGLRTDDTSRCFRRAFESNMDLFAERLHTILKT